MEYQEQNQQALKPKYECLLFDLDDTIYPLSSGLAAEVRKNIQEYMNKKLGIEESKIVEDCYLLYKTYGTTLAGLRAVGYSIDYDEFHSFVHGRLPYELLKPDPVLKNLLHSLPIRKIIFTNGDEKHAARVLARMGLEDCFEDIICFETLNPTNNSNAPAHENGTESPADVTVVNGDSHHSSADTKPRKTPVVCKPNEDAYEQVFKIANINPERTLFFDDSLRNLQTGKRMGLHTVLVGSSQRTEGVDYALETLHNIKEAFPELWEVGEKTESATPSGKVSIEEVVRA